MWGRLGACPERSRENPSLRPSRIGPQPPQPSQKLCHSDVRSRAQRREKWRNLLLFLCCHPERGAFCRVKSLSGRVLVWGRAPSPVHAAQVYRAAQRRNNSRF